MFKEIADELNIDEKIVETVIKHMWSCVKDAIVTGSHSWVTLHGFGTYKINKRFITYYIKSVIKNYRLTKRQEDLDKITYLWKLRSNYSVYLKSKQHYGKSNRV